jgi:hypothetical protein
MTDLGTSLRNALDEIAATGARPIPPVERVYAGARRRKRRRVAVCAALVALVGAVGATAILQRSDSSRLEVANPTGSVLTPLTARLLPKDTIGMQLTFVQDPADAEIAPGDRSTTTQLWGSGAVELGIRTWRSGGAISPGNASIEMVPIRGWTFPAEVVTHPTGAIQVVVSEDSVMVEIASRTLDRADLLAIASSMRIRDSGGVDLDPSTMPPSFEALAEDTMVPEPGVWLSYGYPRREGAILDYSVSSQTTAGRAFDRIIEPPTATVDVGDKTADVYLDTRSRTYTVLWVAARDVQVRVAVGGSGSNAQNETLALRAARSVETVDEAAWRKVLDTAPAPDNSAVTTTLGLPGGTTGTITINGVATTR